MPDIDVVPGSLFPSSAKPRHSKWSKQEELNAQGNLFEKLLIHREERNLLFTEMDPKKLIFMSRSLLLCGLPYRPTDAVEIVRTAKIGGGKICVTFYALGRDEHGRQIPMPRGSDRNFLYWGIHKAIQSQNRFVPFTAAKEFFDSFGISDAGKNYLLLRETMRRFSGLVIKAEHFDNKNESRRIMPIFGSSRLPKSVNPKSSSSEGPLGLLFSQEFFDEFTRTPVPFMMTLLRTLGNKPQLQDHCLFLHHRSFASATTSCITWPALRDQLWQTDSNPWRLRPRMDKAIAALRTVWPELNATTTPKGLLIGPPSHILHLLPTLEP